MIKLQAALLCNAASMEATGLVSVLGAFVDVVAGPQLPIRQQLWVVARLSVEPVDMETPHAFVLSVEHSDGTEQLARVEGATQVQASPAPGAIDPDLPLGLPIVIPLFLEFRRTGLYRFRLLFDGELLWEAPLKVRTLLPQL